jgi:hypothetical protein
VPAPPRLARRRTEPRLDPIRWRRPGRGTLVRLIAVAVLLALGATASWSRPQNCAAPGLAAASPHPPAPLGPARPALAPSASACARGNGQVSRPCPEHGLSVPRGTVGVPVRLAEPTALALVRAGDMVDLLRLDETGHGSTPVAHAALVLGVTGADEPTAGGLLLALRPAEAEKAVAAEGRGFAVLIRPD